MKSSRSRLRVFVNLVALWWWRRSLVSRCWCGVAEGRSVHSEWCVGVRLAGVRLEGVWASEGRRGRCFSLFWTRRVRVSVSPALLASDLVL